MSVEIPQKDEDDDSLSYTDKDFKEDAEMDEEMGLIQGKKRKKNRSWCKCALLAFAVTLTAVALVQVGVVWCFFVSLVLLTHPFHSWRTLMELGWKCAFSPRAWSGPGMPAGPLSFNRTRWGIRSKMARTSSRWPNPSPPLFLCSRTFRGGGRDQGSKPRESVSMY